MRLPSVAGDWWRRRAPAAGFMWDVRRGTPSARSLSPGEHVSLERPALVALHAARLQALVLVLISSVLSMVGLFGALLPEDERSVAYIVLAALSLVGGMLVALMDRWIRLSLADLVRCGSMLRQSASERAADLARLNAELRRRDRERADLFATMSHELRTPLNAIIGHSRVLLDGLDGVLTGEQEADVRQIHDGGQGLLRVMNSTLEFARLEAGVLSAEREPVQVWPVAEEVVALLRPLADAKGLKLSSGIGLALPQVLANEEHLRQVLVNLVGNALKFTSEGAVRLDAEVSGASVVLRVADTGVGIAPSQHDRIFEPFQQAEAGNTRHRDGTGLGLSIARRLVELMAGRIWLESAPGRGSTFYVALERVAVVASIRRKASPKGGVPDRIDILLLGDDRHGQQIPVALTGAQVSFRRACGPDWIGQVRAAQPRLLLADPSLPRAEAWRALAAICTSEVGFEMRLGLLGVTSADGHFVGNALVLPHLRVLSEATGFLARLSDILGGVSVPLDAVPGAAVLVIGPDRAWRRRIVDSIEPAGHRIIEAVTGDVAVATARRTPVAAVVVDIRVGSPGVPEILAELHAAIGRRVCPVAVVVPSSLTPSDLRDLHLGALSWIVADARPLPALALDLAGQADPWRVVHARTPVPEARVAGHR